MFQFLIGTILFRYCTDILMYDIGNKLEEGERNEEKEKEKQLRS